MFRCACKLVLIGAVSTAVLVGGALKADAFWWWGHYRPAVYAYSYSVPYAVPYYTAGYCCDPCWEPCGYTTCSHYLGYRPGPVRRLLFGRYRWYYGCWTTPCVSYDACCSPVTVHHAAPAVVREPQPARRPAEPPADPAPADPPPAIREPDILDPPEEFLQPSPGPIPGNDAPVMPPAAPPGFDFDPLEPARPGNTAVPKPANSGLISIWVPYDAKVIVNGHVTESVGTRRQFVSYGLQPGYSYQYEVKAQIIRDGKILEDVRTVTLTAGDDTAVAFGFQTLPPQAVASQW